MPIVKPKKITDDRSRQNRSAVTNGTRLFAVATDGRTTEARRYRDIVAAVVADRGGAEVMTEVAFQLARRFAATAVKAEAMEADLAKGHPIDMEEHGKLTLTMTRIANHLGLERKAREVKTLDAYLRDKQFTQGGAA